MRIFNQCAVTMAIVVSLTTAAPAERLWEGHIHLVDCRLKLDFADYGSSDMQALRHIEIKTGRAGKFRQAGFDFVRSYLRRFASIDGFCAGCGRAFEGSRSRRGEKVRSTGRGGCESRSAAGFDIDQSNVIAIDFEFDLGGPKIGRFELRARPLRFVEFRGIQLQSDEKSVVETQPPPERLDEQPVRRQRENLIHTAEQPKKLAETKRSSMIFFPLCGLSCHAYSDTQRLVAATSGFLASDRIGLCHPFLKFISRKDSSRHVET